MRSLISTHKLTSKRIGLFGAACLLVGGVMWASTATASARDSDGSRLQARSMSVNSTARDTLLPPRDRADWRSFKLKAKSSVSLSLTHKPAKAKVKLTLVDARGKQISSTISSKGAARIKQTLKPGIYYIAVSSSSKVSYSLALK